MYTNFKLLVIIFVGRCLPAVTRKPLWTYDLLSIEVENDMPDVVDFNITIKQVSRGVYRAVGKIEILQDLTDDMHGELQLYYSSNGMPNTYVRTAIAIPEKTLSGFFNDFYRPMAMEQLRNCTNDALYSSTRFSPPLTKRSVELDKCWVSNEDMPSYMRSGYYQAVFIFTNLGKAKITVDMLIKPMD
ncbi:uncharacterized protein LOC142231364 [Haematobia irritans]|uniref:uncharacterized protein LOC142231364 n=1 Tax=Haematobia irritans TaxID=7368 RepID=UPI003F4FBCCE